MGAQQVGDDHDLRDLAAADPSGAPTGRQRGVARRHLPTGSMPSWEIAWLATFGLGFVALALLFPASGDDWAWGSSIGAERLQQNFANYNGRYVANLIVLALTRLPFVAALVIGTTISASVFFVLYVARNRTPAGYAITTALFLLMPRSLWSQAISWLSGFVNYGVSALLLLAYFAILCRERHAAPAPTRANIVTQAVVAFAAALFMENITLFFVVSGVAVVLWRTGSRAGPRSTAWSRLIGFTAGAAVMFSNGAYTNAAAATGGYQRVGASGGLVTRVFDTMSTLLVVDNFAVTLALAAALVSVAALSRRAATVATVALVYVPITIAVAIVGALHIVGAAKVVAPLWRHGAGVAALLLGVGIVGTATMVGLKRDESAGLLALVATLAVLIAPLAVVSPIGPRNFYGPYLVILVLVNVALRLIATRTAVRLLAPLAVLAAALVVAVSAAYLAAYISIDKAADSRLADIRAAVAAGATSVTVPRLPLPEYTHMPDPTPGLWADRYKLFYDLPTDLKIILAR